MSHNIIISKSTKNKKYMANIDKTKNIHFGQSGASDMTMHNDSDRKKKYINRHKKNEDWSAKGYRSAGFLAKHILWNKKTIKESVNDINKRFKNFNVKPLKSLPRNYTLILYHKYFYV